MKRYIILVINILLLSNFIIGQQGIIKFHTLNFEISSGSYNGNGMSLEKKFTEIIDLGEIPWTRIKFENTELGQKSYIKITNLIDGEYQILNSNSIEKWEYTSAFFNGGLLKIELFVDKDDINVNFNVREIFIGIRQSELQTPSADGICDGIDNRNASNHKAVGRILIQRNNEIISVCTGWISSIGKIITASHCFDDLFNYPGAIAVIEFNVPYSEPDGTIRHPSPEFQFAIDRNSVIRSGDMSVGNDWAIFSAYNNSLQQPIQVQNSSLIVYDIRDINSIFSLIGFGLDGPPPFYGGSVRDSTNHTQQKDFTQPVSQTGTNNIIFDGDIIKYKIDAHNSNSGSPIINETYNCAIGIHTHGECQIDGFNKGTSVSNVNFFNSLYPPRTVFLNQTTEDGSIISGSKLYYWKNSTFQPIEIYTTPVPIVHNTNSIIVRADTNLLSGRKYNLWRRDNDQLTQNINIHRHIDLNNHITKITSIFNQTFPNIVIRNQIDNMHFNDGLQISFKDPWLIDYPDLQYGNTKRNQGMDAPFKQRTSPFYPDYTTSYNGDVYKGVFLNQDFRIPNQPYYSVKADYLQTFNLSQTGRTHKFYFQGWSANPQNGAEFRFPNNLETPIIFKQQNTTVQANYKGTQLSNS